MAEGNESVAPPGHPNGSNGPPSPALSPSIHSLLNSSTSAEHSPDDYFSQDNNHTSSRSTLESSASPAVVFGPGTKTAPDRPASSSGLTHLLASDETYAPSPTPPVTEDRPRSSHKRPRTDDEANTAPPPPPPAPAAAAPPTEQAHGQGQGRPLEASIFMVEPIDEFTREVADWLWGFCQALNWEVLEIEAKVGILVDTRTQGQPRIHLPVPIETILTDDSGLRFVSNMTVGQHKAYNQLLNSRVEESAAPSYPYAPVRYSHTRETDTFHQDRGRKLRVTRNPKMPNAQPMVVEKTRIADMNIFSPKRGFDWRISVNLEQPAPLPSGPATLTRFKDRISYSHQLFQVDLTQVTSDARSTSVLHELEVEFRDSKVLMYEAQKEQRGEPNSYLEMVQCFLNNIRMLIRNAADP